MQIFHHCITLWDFSLFLFYICLRGEWSVDNKKICPYSPLLKVFLWKSAVGEPITPGERVWSFTVGKRPLFLKSTYEQGSTDERKFFTTQSTLLTFATFWTVIALVLPLMDFVFINSFCNYSFFWTFCSSYLWFAHLLLIYECGFT